MVFSFICVPRSLQTAALWRVAHTSCSLDSSRGPVRPMNRQLAYLHSRSHRAFLLCTHSLGKPALCGFAFKCVLDDLPNQPRGIFVTRSGYQQGAKDFAAAQGIILYELDEQPPKKNITIT